MNIRESNVSTRTSKISILKKDQTKKPKSKGKDDYYIKIEITKEYDLDDEDESAQISYDGMDKDSLNNLLTPRDLMGMTGTGG